MTTDTPRTDAASFSSRDPLELLKTSQQLERELAASQAEVARLQKELDATCNAEELRQERETRKRAETEVERLKEELDDWDYGTRAKREQTRAEKAEAELAEIKETYASIVQQPHFDEREVHCSCVPALRAEVERLKAQLFRAVTIAESLSSELYFPDFAVEIAAMKASLSSP
jgi:DNA repair exonuclease SbcCD ATPase subunit